MGIRFRGSQTGRVGCGITYSGRSLLRVHFHEGISRVQCIKVHMGSYSSSGEKLLCWRELNNSHDPFTVAAPGYWIVVGVTAHTVG